MIAFTWLAVATAVSYFVGAIPFGYLIAKWRGVDIFQAGSGNIGATNVGRVLGRKYGILVFLLDFSKGALPVLAAMNLTRFSVPAPPEWLGVVAGLAAFLGHLFPIYLGFRGGKGVATGAGVVLVLVPWAALAAVVAWVVVVASCRYVSAASVVAAIVLAGYQLLVRDQPWSGPHMVVTLFCSLAALLVVVRHATNLRRLMSGTESRLKESARMFAFSKTVHVLALGLWFGTVVFFTLAGGLMIQAFTTTAGLEAKDRPLWFPVPEAFHKDPPSQAFPNPLRLEQGSRAFGVAVSPLFPWYYGIQTVCALLCTLTAVGWCLSEQGFVHRTRAVLVVLALLTLGAGWWLEGVVSSLRVDRELLSDVVLNASPVPSALELAAAEKARADFGMWHGVSLIQNFTTLLLVAVAMALAAHLPQQPRRIAPQIAEPALGDAPTELLTDVKGLPR
jgi:acyl-phosphate glycerol 3-phosphate acyltransferase